MGYSNFKKIFQIKEELKIISFKKELFDKNIKPVQQSEWLKTTLSYSSFARSNNEKTKSESIVQPILVELIKKNNNFITYFSGSNLEINTEKNLNGECDFIICKDKGYYDLDNPIFIILEAKDHDIKLGIPQCGAQMYAANLFNHKNNYKTNFIYGCVTTGDMWVFLKIVENNLFIDKKIYYLSEVEKILGVFQKIIYDFK